MTDTPRERKPGEGSLLDDAERADPPAPEPTDVRTRRKAEDRRLLKRVAMVGLAVVAIVGGTWGVIALIPRPTPDYLEDDLAEILEYTLISDDFNALPVEQRLMLLRDLIERFRTMSGADSAAMAIFASTIRDKMRRQLEENVQELFVDVMDVYATDYAAVDPKDQSAYMRDSLLGMTRLMEEITGEDMGLPEGDDERLDAMRKQAKRDEEMFKENAPRRMDAQRVVPFIKFLQRDASDVAAPRERARVTKYMRDMTRYLREQDMSTGEPLDRGG